MQVDGGIVISPDGSLEGLGDPYVYDMAMAQMHAHMLLADGGDNHSLDAASAHSDEEIRNIMGPESRVSFAPHPVPEPMAKVARSDSSRQLSGKSSRPGTIGGGTGGEGARQRGGIPEKENVRTRARPRKTHEPEPFLSIDTLPTQKEHQGPARTREKSAGSEKGNQLMRKKFLGSGKSQTRAPPGTPAHPVFGVSRSRMGRSSSAMSSEWNALVPRPKHLPSAVLKNPVNKRVKDPFKHNINKPDFDKADRPMSPGQTMKERTAMATVHLARTMAKQKGEEESRIGGRLLKGRLKPLYPVKVDGPTMQHCRGVIAGVEFEENPFMNNPSRTVARRRQIVSGMLTKDFLFERPLTPQSVHHTSVASDLSDGREKEADQELEHHTPEAQITEGTRMPPNSLASTGDVPHRSSNLARGGASTSVLSSDVFEIDEIPRNTAMAEPALIGNPSEEDIPKIQESNSRQGSAGKRPNTGKAVRFADSKEKDDKAPGSDAKEEVENAEEGPKVEEGCKPWNFVTDQDGKDDPDVDDQGGSGGGNGNVGQPDQSASTANQAQNASEGKNDSGSNHKNGTGNCEADGSDLSDEENQENVDTEGEIKKRFISVRASYNSVLYTSEDVKFPRAGSAPRPSSKKGSKQKQVSKRQKTSQSKDMSNMALVVAEKDIPTQDYYDQFARISQSDKRSRSTNTVTRPRSGSCRMTAKSTHKAAASLQLRRPASASVPSKGKEPKVQFVIKPNAGDLHLDDGEATELGLRLNETPSRRPHSARTQTSGVPCSARSIDSHIKPVCGSKNAKNAATEADFKVEGAKMSQGIKAGICTECGKPTNKIADYWEETGSLVCDVCDRTTRAAENQKMEWLRRKVSQVYVEDYPRDEVLAITEHGEDGNVTGLEELERSLAAVRSEINQCVIDSEIDIPIFTSEDEEISDEDDEILALTGGERDYNDTEQVTDVSENVVDKTQVKLTEGEISKILTNVEVDPADLSLYEMRVFWYQEHCKSKLKSKSSQSASSGSIPRAKSSEDVYEQLKRAMGQKSDEGEIGVYSVKVMYEENKGATQVLLGETDQGSKHVKHFRGERLSSVFSGESDATMETRLSDLGVSGTAAKLTKTRPRSGKKQVPEAVAPFAPLCFRINARPPEGFLYYFAYGTDMNPDRMESYIQRSVAADRLWGLLYGFRLIFNKKGLDAEAGAFPNIELCSASSTEGCLYLITLEELDKLDRHLGYPEHYDHAMLPVWLLNCSEPDEYGVAQYCVPALVLIAKNEWIHKGENPLPNEYMIDQCLKGGSNFLSPAYHQHLESLRTVEVAC